MTVKFPWPDAFAQQTDFMVFLLHSFFFSSEVAFIDFLPCQKYKISKGKTIPDVHWEPLLTQI